MKLKKYTFRSPLFGYIECENLLPDTDGPIELSPRQMCWLYNDSDELGEFLNKHASDLTPFIPEELTGVVLYAHFGDCSNRQ